MLATPFEIHFNVSLSNYSALDVSSVFMAQTRSTTLRSLHPPRSLLFSLTFLPSNVENSNSVGPFLFLLYFSFFFCEQRSFRHFVFLTCMRRTLKLYEYKKKRRSLGSRYYISNIYIT